MEDIILRFSFKPLFALFPLFLVSVVLPLLLWSGPQIIPKESDQR